jgi:erythronate-4-phosphate dehydrogenase
MIHIVADSNIPFLRGALDDRARVTYLPAPEISRNQLKDADALIIRTRTGCDATLLDGTPVKYIATATIGHDHIDAAYCARKGIHWSNAPGCNAGSVMQYLASALAHVAISERKRFEDICIGIIGVGHVGKKVEQLCRTLRMKVLLNDPPRARKEGPTGFTSLDELLAKADIVSMHMPLLRSGPDISHHLANEDFFNRIKPGAWFANTARGEVMHTEALKNALRAGKLGGAVIDVWENEPEIDHELLKLASITTPHIAGYSLDGKANGTAAAVQAVSRFFKLGLDNWYPHQIPKPAQPVITSKNDTQSTEALVHDAFMHTYNILADSNKLKSDPKKFEYFRDNYPPRREFQAYSINGQTLGLSATVLLEKLRFRAD